MDVESFAMEGLMALVAVVGWVLVDEIYKDKNNVGVKKNSDDVGEGDTENWSFRLVETRLFGVLEILTFLAMVADVAAEVARTIGERGDSVDLDSTILVDLVFSRTISITVQM